jgi:hypothetical protein
MFTKHSLADLKRKWLKNKKSKLITILVLMMSMSGFAQTHNHDHDDGDHADHVENGTHGQRANGKQLDLNKFKLVKNMHQNLEDLLFRMPEGE